MALMILSYIWQGYVPWYDINNFSMVTIDSTTADTHESTLGTDTNNLENDTGAHTNLYSAQVEGAFGLFGNSMLLVTLLPTLVVLIMTINPVLRMKYFLIVTVGPVLRMNAFYL